MTYSMEANQTNTEFSLPDLPYGKGDLAPHLTEETLDFHHGKHHNTYVVNLNKLLEDHPMKGKSLEEIILESSGKANLAGIFNNAAQIWNHTFYWHSMAKDGGGRPSGELLVKIEEDFGSFEEFVTQFKQAGATQFGSGWAWLVLAEGKLKVVKTLNAETPITSDMKPLMTCDVWEHAYYIDYRNKRPDYIATFLDHLVNWNFANKNFENAR